RRFSFLHYEPCRSRLCGLPSARAAAAGVPEGCVRCDAMSAKVSPTIAELHELAAERILVLDGAMGTMIQALGLDEETFRGARFDAWNREVRGNNDLLNLTRPGPIRDIHLAYLRAGAD